MFKKCYKSVQKFFHNFFQEQGATVRNNAKQHFEAFQQKNWQSSVFLCNQLFHIRREGRFDFLTSHRSKNQEVTGQKFSGKRE